jgi:hypothetical protein
MSFREARSHRRSDPIRAPDEQAAGTLQEAEAHIRSRRGRRKSNSQSHSHYHEAEKEESKSQRDRWLHDDDLERVDLFQARQSYITGRPVHPAISIMQATGMIVYCSFAISLKARKQTFGHNHRDRQVPSPSTI